MRFSIIVPIYKVELYLRECLDSILNQSYSDFELILVDDGSPDLCPKICDEYTMRDIRIKTIHKVNDGLSSARNEGLLIALGEYIVFVDSDDVLCSDALQKLNDCIETSSLPDIIIGNIVHWFKDSEKIVMNNYEFVKFQGKKTIFEINELYAAKRVQLPWRTYQSVYNRSFLIDNHIFFDKTLIGAEDCDFYLKVIQKVISYKVTDIPLVKYRVGREGSIINSPSYCSIMGQLKTFVKAFEIAECFPNSKLMHRYFADRYTNIVILVNLLRSHTDREQCYKFIQEHKNIMQYTSFDVKYVIAKMTWRVFGIERGSNILLTINRLRKV